MDDKAYRWIIVEGPADDLARSGYVVAELDALVDKLRGGGVEVAEGGAELAAARGVDRIFTTVDPMGNAIELVEEVPDAAAPFASDVLDGAFVTGIGGAGHQVLVAKGVAREDYLAFYRDLLGFRISDIIIEELAPGIVADLIFLHCNPRHHTVAFGDLPSPKRTHHFMVEVADIVDVGRAYERCLAAGQPLEMHLGMHPNDQMFSFYVVTPSGFSVEYGCGGRLIDEATWEVTTLDALHSWGHQPTHVVSELVGATSGAHPSDTDAADPAEKSDK